MFGTKKWLVGVFVIGLAIVGLSFLNISDNLVYFYTPSEAIAKAREIAGKNIRLGAMVKLGSIQRGDDPLDIEFIATDRKGHDIKVKHHGIAPDMFKEGQGVVVEGRLQDGGNLMISKRLLVKHSEEYKKPEDHSKMSAEYLQKSLFKNEKTQ